jgi:hypothetical protein
MNINIGIGIYKYLLNSVYGNVKLRRHSSRSIRCVRCVKTCSCRKQVVFVINTNLYCIYIYVCVCVCVCVYIYCLVLK